MVQKRPFHLNPATDRGPAKIGKYQKLEPFLSHMNVLRNRHREMALDQQQMELPFVEPE